ncbi:M28 family peptidase [Cecembia lonarensis]|uniref:Alkaline phosphatase isozyme conversion aminopeptidase n=1 Tax=Cecembia lonarensis (strain CCUG 58316 / KCTC 22772 / LW9) TaxID=1225176 RepID=K1LWD2_CECL9|nr:M28 family peptidase [Cecembia lonarensis]EKB48469.1 alkaline phosphatase isozyme conversion aminopeptidase [Cecembia lonarensis LW9]
MNNLIRILWVIFLLTPLICKAQKIDEEQLIQDMAYLASDELEGRKPLSEGSLKARALFKDRFTELGLTSQYRDFTQYFSFRNRRDGKLYENAANIIGFIPGESTEKLIVITAHYDHLGRQGDKIFNGADDNASGAAALLAFASYFIENRPQHSMMFVALDAEEMGHQGAKALVADFPFPLDHVVLNINMDMISRNENNELYAAGTYHYPFLKPLIQKVSEGRTPNLLFGHDEPEMGRDDWTLASDHAQFHLKGVPFIYFGVEDHEDYHKETDTFENIQTDFYINAANLILDIIMSLDKDLVQ